MLLRKLRLNQPIDAESIAGAAARAVAARSGSYLTLPASRMGTGLSIHDAEPLERGGVIARQGFTYQDHVAVAFFLQMLDDHLLAAVWCEAEDDITLIWRRGDADEVEYVQVKRSELNQLWTAARLCEPTAARPTSPDGGSPPQAPNAHARNKRAAPAAAVRANGADRAAGGEPRGEPARGGNVPRPAPATLLERSLAHDRCTEPCSFRVVTAWPIDAALQPLTLPLSHAHRQPGHEAIESVVTAVRERAGRRGAYTSPNGNDAEFWARRVVWQVRESVTAVENDNVRVLDDYVYRAGAFLAPDQRRELYARLLALVKAAAEADWVPDAAKKKLQRAAVLDFVAAEIRKAQHPDAGQPGSGLVQKMTAAGFATPLIEEAWDMRRRYRREVLAPRYLSVADRELVEDEVAARLQQLRAGLDAGAIADAPLAFHHRCIEAMVELRGALPAHTAPPAALLQGAMYDLTHRCLHRFVPAGPAALAVLSTAATVAAGHAADRANGSAPRGTDGATATTSLSRGERA